MNPLLLCTDLDRTLLPNGPQPESAQARELFRRFAAREEVILVYVTGRHKTLVREAIEIYRIPLPDYVIADVGSTIYRLEDNSWVYWQQWESEIEKAWNGYSCDELHSLLSGVRELRLQERG